MDIPERRRLKIKNLVEENASMSVEELMKRIGVSQATIRRDLIELENQGFLKKVHGGCITKEIGEEEGYSKEEINEYYQYILMADEFSKI